MLRPYPLFTFYVVSSLQRKIKETLPREAFLTSEEAVIAAAAAEAITLAKAAVEVAKEAAQLLESDLFLKLEASNDFESPYEIFMDDVIKKEQIKHNYSATTVTESFKGHISMNSSQDMSISDLMKNELDLNQNIAVRSKRQVERKARRARVAEKATLPLASVKSGSSRKKKRAVFQEIDYSDPLHYLRGTTSSAKLLTSAEEQEYSEGIQVGNFPVLYITEYLWFLVFCLQITAIFDVLMVNFGICRIYCFYVK